MLHIFQVHRRFDLVLTVTMISQTQVLTKYIRFVFKPRAGSMKAETEW